MRWTIFALLLFSFSCSSDHSTKNLTNDTAGPLIQSQIETKNSGFFEANGSPLAGLIAEPSYEDYQKGEYPPLTPAGRLHRLLLAGLASQSPREERYPDLSGPYSDTGELGFHQLVLSMQPASVDVNGQFHLLYYKNQNGSYADCSGPVTGHINRDGTVLLRFRTTSSYYCGSQAWDGPFRIEQNGTDITLSKGATHSGAAPTQPGWEVHGKSNGNQVVVTSYTYALSKDFSDKLLPGSRVLNAGKVKVEKVNQVLLGETDTFAHGDFSWTAELNRAGEAYLGMKEVAGQGTALFRKQPDGAWVCVGAELRYPNQLGL